MSKAVIADRRPRDHGWGYAVGWLCFLAYPIVGTATAGVHPLVKAAMFADIAAFAAVFVGFFFRSRWHMVDVRRALGTIAVLGALILPLVPVLHIAATAMVTYLLAVAAFGLPVRGVAAFFVLVGGGLVSMEFWAPGFALDASAGLIVAAVAVVLLLMRSLQTRTAADERAEDERRALAARLAIVAERERVARDVHDILGHSLTVIALKSELAARLVDLDIERARTEMAEVNVLTRQALGEVRATVGGLRVLEIDSELRATASALDAANMAYDLPVSGDAVDPAYRGLFAWVLREAVTNVVRHAGASRCRVTLGGSRIVIEDDGRGFPGDVGDPGALAVTRGNGLRGIGERVGPNGELLLSVSELGGARVAVVMGSGV